ncbi:MAG TPA: hypothetical protein VIJ82_29675 [Streptosporangiaceae bacterium]
MCGTKACGCATASSSVPAAAVAVVVVCATVSSATAHITGALLAILATLGVASALGVAGLVYLLRRDQVQMWQPAPARQAARPALGAPPGIRQVTAPRLRAIAAPTTVNLIARPMADGVLTTAAPEEMMIAGH